MPKDHPAPQAWRTQKAAPSGPRTTDEAAAQLAVLLAAAIEERHRAGPTGNPYVTIQAPPWLQEWLNAPVAMGGPVADRYSFQDDLVNVLTDQLDFQLRQMGYPVETVDYHWETGLVRVRLDETRPAVLIDPVPGDPDIDPWRSFKNADIRRVDAMADALVRAVLEADRAGQIGAGAGEGQDVVVLGRDLGWPDAATMDERVAACRIAMSILESTGISLLAAESGAIVYRPYPEWSFGVRSHDAGGVKGGAVPSRDSDIRDVVSAVVDAVWMAYRSQGDLAEIPAPEELESWMRRNDGLPAQIDIVLDHASAIILREMSVRLLLSLEGSTIKIDRASSYWGGPDKKGSTPTRKPDWGWIDAELDTVDAVLRAVESQGHGSVLIPAPDSLIVMRNATSQGDVAAVQLDYILEVSRQAIEAELYSAGYRGFRVAVALPPGSDMLEIDVQAGSKESNDLTRKSEPIPGLSRLATAVPPPLEPWDQVEELIALYRRAAEGRPVGYQVGFVQPDWWMGLSDEQQRRLLVTVGEELWRTLDVDASPHLAGTGRVLLGYDPGQGVIYGTVGRFHPHAGEPYRANAEERQAEEDMLATLVNPMPLRSFDWDTPLDPAAAVPTLSELVADLVDAVRAVLKRTDAEYAPNFSVPLPPSILQHYDLMERPENRDRVRGIIERAEQVLDGEGFNFWMDLDENGLDAVTGFLADVQAHPADVRIRQERLAAEWRERHGEPEPDKGIEPVHPVYPEGYRLPGQTGGERVQAPPHAARVAEIVWGYQEAARDRPAGYQASFVAPAWWSSLDPEEQDQTLVEAGYNLWVNLRIDSAVSHAGNGSVWLGYNPELGVIYGTVSSYPRVGHDPIRSFPPSLKGSTPSRAPTWLDALVAINQTVRAAVESQAGDLVEIPFPREFVLAVEQDERGEPDASGSPVWTRPGQDGFLDDTLDWLDSLLRERGYQVEILPPSRPLGILQIRVLSRPGVKAFDPAGVKMTDAEWAALTPGEQAARVTGWANAMAAELMRQLDRARMNEGRHQGVSAWIPEDAPPAAWDDVIGVLENMRQGNVHPFSGTQDQLIDPDRLVPNSVHYSVEDGYGNAYDQDPDEVRDKRRDEAMSMLNKLGMSDEEITLQAARNEASVAPAIAARLAQVGGGTFAGVEMMMPVVWDSHNLQERPRFFEELNRLLAGQNLQAIDLRDQGKWNHYRLVPLQRSVAVQFKSRMIHPQEAMEESMYRLIRRAIEDMTLQPGRQVVFPYPPDWPRFADGDHQRHSIAPDAAMRVSDRLMQEGYDVSIGRGANGFSVTLWWPNMFASTEAQIKPFDTQAWRKGGAVPTRVPAPHSEGEEGVVEELYQATLLASQRLDERGRAEFPFPESFLAIIRPVPFPDDGTPADQEASRTESRLRWAQVERILDRVDQRLAKWNLHLIYESDEHDVFVVRTLWQDEVKAFDSKSDEIREEDEFSDAIYRAALKWLREGGPTNPASEPGRRDPRGVEARLSMTIDWDQVGLLSRQRMGPEFIRMRNRAADAATARLRADGYPVRILSGWGGIAVMLYDSPDDPELLVRAFSKAVHPPSLDDLKDMLLDWVMTMMAAPPRIDGAGYHWVAPLPPGWPHFPTIEPPPGWGIEQTGEVQRADAETRDRLNALYIQAENYIQAALAQRGLPVTVWIGATNISVRQDLRGKPERDEHGRIVQPVDEGVPAWDEEVKDFDSKGGEIQEVDELSNAIYLEILRLLRDGGMVNWTPVRLGLGLRPGLPPGTLIRACEMAKARLWADGYDVDVWYSPQVGVAAAYHLPTASTGSESANFFPPSLKMTDAEYQALGPAEQAEALTGWLDGVVRVANPQIMQYERRNRPHPDGGVMVPLPDGVPPAAVPALIDRVRDWMDDQYTHNPPVDLEAFNGFLSITTVRDWVDPAEEWDERSHRHAALLARTDNWSEEQVTEAAAQAVASRVRFAASMGNPPWDRKWETVLGLAVHDPEQVDRFFARLDELLGPLGYRVTSTGRTPENTGDEWTQRWAVRFSIGPKSAQAWRAKAPDPDPADAARAREQHLRNDHHRQTHDWMVESLEQVIREAMRAGRLNRGRPGSSTQTLIPKPAGWPLYGDGDTQGHWDMIRAIHETEARLRSAGLVVSIWLSSDDALTVAWYNPAPGEPFWTPEE